MKKETDVSRRSFLKGTVMGAGALTAGFGAGLLTPGTAHAAPTLPLPYYYVDPDDVRKRAYDKYFAGGG